MSDDCSRNTVTSSTTPPHSGDRTRPQLSDAEVHRLLANERRYTVLTRLVTGPADPVSVDALIDFVAEREQPRPGPGTARERIATELHHVHLPILADAGVIDYDPVAGTVRYVASDSVEKIVSTADEPNGR